ncbi:unnamed protein product, partial [Discosporangium mesarthrocarpum]
MVLRSGSVGEGANHHEDLNTNKKAKEELVMVSPVSYVSSGGERLEAMAMTSTSSKDRILQSYQSFASSECFSDDTSDALSSAKSISTGFESDDVGDNIASDGSSVRPGEHHQKKSHNGHRRTISLSSEPPEEGEGQRRSSPQQAFFPLEPMTPESSARKPPVDMLAALGRIRAAQVGPAVGQSRSGRGAQGFQRPPPRPMSQSPTSPTSAGGETRSEGRSNSSSLSQLDRPQHVRTGSSSVSELGSTSCEGLSPMSGTGTGTYMQDSPEKMPSRPASKFGEGNETAETAEEAGTGALGDPGSVLGSPGTVSAQQAAAATGLPSPLSPVSPVGATMARAERDGGGTGALGSPVAGLSSPLRCPPSSLLRPSPPSSTMTSSGSRHASRKSPPPVISPLTPRCGAGAGAEARAESAVVAEIPPLSLSALREGRYPPPLISPRSPADRAKAVEVASLSRSSPKMHWCPSPASTG